MENSLPEPAGSRAAQDRSAGLEPGPTAGAHANGIGPALPSQPWQEPRAALSRCGLDKRTQKVYDSVQ